MSLTFEWDEVKASINFKKHAIGFEEAQSVFADISACIFDDEWHPSSLKNRELIIGHSQNSRILIVCFTELCAKTIRIINARSATKKEIKKYENNNPFRRQDAFRI